MNLTLGSRMRRNGVCGVLGVSVIVAGCLTAIPALAQSSQEWNRCAGKDGAAIDQLIEGCTIVIQSGSETPEKLALALVDRVSAYMTKGDYDRAIQDYDRAVSLDPKNFLAFNNRGFAYGGKGNFDRAIQDYDQAISRNPNAALAFYTVAPRAP
jgi:tetratricopeptide (TPR) repeat protein